SVALNNFNDYRNHIVDTLKELKKNANDNKRKFNYAGVTPLSSGYDSTAIAVLASEIEEMYAVGILNSRGNSEEDTLDDGSIAAKCLGMTFDSVDRLGYRSKIVSSVIDMPEIE